MIYILEFGSTAQDKQVSPVKHANKSASSVSKAHRNKKSI